MKFNASLDVNVVAHESTDEIAVLLDLEAPAPTVDVVRPPSSLQVVLDRSGSMSGAPIEGAKKALIDLVQRLEPTDNFGVVTFDDEAQVVVAGRPADRQAGRDRADRVDPARRDDRPELGLPARPARAAPGLGR